MKLCPFGQDSESEIWERLNFCLKNGSKNKTPPKFAQIGKKFSSKIANKLYDLKKKSKGSRPQTNSKLICIN